MSDLGTGGPAQIHVREYVWLTARCFFADNTMAESSVLDKALGSSMGMPVWSSAPSGAWPRNHALDDYVAGQLIAA